MSGISTPVAILLGSVIVGVSLGVGVYFGLRQRTSAAAPSASAALVPAAPASVAAVTNEGGPIAASEAARPAALARPAAPVDASGSRGEVLAILEHARAQLVTKCWTPTDSRGGPPHETVRAHVVFDADGQQLGRSFLESGEKRPGVGTCLELTLPPMHISPPGEKLTLEVPFSLP